mmetsp:Transcript_7619/g.9471  ORF Transcript_7619/g.9471 Transcript_7619/m.9471 type:complete len:252 (-) Transcript_7619:182-937(-)
MAEMKQAKVNDPLKAFSDVTKKLDFASQAQFFLNAMWDKNADNAEDIYGYVKRFYELNDLQESMKAKNYKQTNGKSLGTFLGNRLLELAGMTVTALELKKILKELDADADGQLSFLEFAVWKYKVDIKYLMAQPQGTNEALEEAKKALKAVQKEIDKVEKKKKKLSKKAKGDGVMAKAAANELEQLLASDPMPIRKALVTAQAAVRKAQKGANLKAPGASWWITRDLEEMKKYKPGKKPKKSFNEVMKKKD